MKITVKEKLHYMKASVFHPFDSFYEIRFRQKGSFLLAAALLCFFGIMKCVEYQYTGFVMNKRNINEMNSLTIFATAILAFILFIVSNWSVTTLMNGKGKMEDITIVCGYSMVPVLVTMAVKVFVSNYIIKEEIMILQVVEGCGIVWFLFMMIAGLCVIHEYTFTKNIMSILLTFAAAAIILFLGILFFTLIEQMITFINDVIEELMRHL